MNCNLNDKVEMKATVYNKPTRSYEEYNKAGLKFLKEVFKNPKLLENKNIYKKVLSNLDETQTKNSK